MITENNLSIGSGIYTIRDLSFLLDLPYNKAHYWLNRYWDGKLGSEYKRTYSWTINKTKAVNFYTLIEFYVMYHFANIGIKPRKVLQAHSELSSKYNTLHPFAMKEILSRISTDGNKVYLNSKSGLYNLDGKRQIEMPFIESFFVKLDFNDTFLASRFWPCGKDKSILVDPARKFGHPVVGETNIYPGVLHGLYLGGEKTEFIAQIYEITVKEVKDSIEFCSKKAA
jgi:uncharacterized protein (DUF433 family)